MKEIKIQKAETYQRVYATITDLIFWFGLSVAVSIFSSIYPKWWTFILNILISGLFFPMYMVLCNYSKGGMSFGKRILSIKVVDKKTSQKLTMLQSVKREWLVVVTGIIYVVTRVITLFLNYDYYNAMFGNHPSVYVGVTKQLPFTYHITLIGLLMPFIWLLLESITTTMDASKESVQDRVSSSLTINVR